MTRTEKYPETSTFHYYNANPHNRKGGDCVIRAICTFLNISWEQCIREMTEVGIKHGFVLNDRNTIEKYLKEKGFEKMPMPRKCNKLRYTVKEFCNEIAEPDCRYVLALARHEVSIVGCRVWDIWDCTNKSVGNYWIRKIK